MTKSSKSPEFRAYVILEDVPNKIFLMTEAFSFLCFLTVYSSIKNKKKKEKCFKHK